jgi:hypothetical protein
LGWRQIRLARTIEFQFPGWFVTDEVKKACERTTQIEGITANELRGQYRYGWNGGKLPLVWLFRSGKSPSRYGFQRRARHAKFCGILVSFASKWEVATGSHFPQTSRFLLCLDALTLKKFC